MRTCGKGGGGGADAPRHMLFRWREFKTGARPGYLRKGGGGSAFKAAADSSEARPTMAAAAPAEETYPDGRGSGPRHSPRIGPTRTPERG